MVQYFTKLKTGRQWHYLSNVMNLSSDQNPASCQSLQHRGAVRLIRSTLVARGGARGAHLYSAAVAFLQHMALSHRLLLARCQSGHMKRVV